MSVDHIAAAACYIAAFAVPAIAIAIAHARDVLNRAPLRDDDALDQPCGCEDGDCWDARPADVIAHAETITRQAARDQAIIDTAEGDL